MMNRRPSTSGRIVRFIAWCLLIALAVLATWAALTATGVLPYGR